MLKTFLTICIVTCAVCLPVPAQDAPQPLSAPPRYITNLDTNLTYREYFNSQSPLVASIGELRAAETDADKQAAKEKVKEALGKEYEAFLAQNEKQLEELAERLNKLREQLDRRRQAKDKMVDLRLQMIISEADGLGWPGHISPFWRDGDVTWNGFDGLFGATPHPDAPDALDDLDEPHPKGFR